MLKCRYCIHLIDGMKDEGPDGGGTNNTVRCRMRPEIEEMVRKELKYYGSTGTPCSTWLVAQTGYDTGYEIGTDPGEDRVRVFVNDEGEEVAEFRDPKWIAIDHYLDAMPRMEIRNDLCRVRDHLGNEIRHHTGRRFKPRPVASYIRVDHRTEWLMRRESAVIDDVLWRAMKGRCPHYMHRPEDLDEALMAHYAPVVLEADIEDDRVDREFALIESGETPAMLVFGHWTRAAACA